MALLKSRIKLKGSTLIETLVAMMVILISLVFCGIIYVNILSSGKSHKTFRAQTLLNEIAIKTRGEKKFVDEKMENSDIVIQKSIRTYNGIKDLYLQSLTASDTNGKMFGEYRELIFVPEQ